MILEGTRDDWDLPGSRDVAEGLGHLSPLLVHREAVTPNGLPNRIIRLLGFGERRVEL